MKKVQISKRIAEEAKDREKRWKELRGFLEKYEDPKRKSNFEQGRLMDAPEKKSEESEIDLILKSLGLEKYAKAMKDNGVDDLEILQELTEEHLEQIGMVLGHRIKLMKKIKELKGKESNNAIASEISPMNEKKIYPAKEIISPGSHSSSSIGVNATNKANSYEMTVKNPQKGIESKPNKKEPLSSSKKTPPLDDFRSSPVYATRNIGAVPEFLSQTNNFISKTGPQENLTTKGVSIEIQADASDLSHIRMKEKPDHSKQSTAETAGIYAKTRVKGEEPLPIIMSKPPVASKQATVGKSINTYQPHSVEAEKVVKLSEIVKESPEEVKAQDQIKWDQFSYVPYKPSEEIQAAIVNKPASRPHSATNRVEPKPSNVEFHKEKFDVAGWES